MLSVHSLPTGRICSLRSGYSSEIFPKFLKPWTGENDGGTARLAFLTQDEKGEYWSLPEPTRNPQRTREIVVEILAVGHSEYKHRRCPTCAQCQHGMFAVGFSLHNPELAEHRG